MSEMQATPPAWNAEAHERTRRSAFAGSVGTLIEYYDFSLYGYMAVIIAPLFFPGGDPTVSLLAFPLTLLCLGARTRVKETHKARNPEQHSPVMQVFRRQPWALLQATGISAATNGTAYIGLTYLSIHMIHRLGYPAGNVYWVAMLAIGVAALLMPLGGYLGDRIGLHRLMTLGLMGYVLLTYPMMSLMSHGLAMAGIAYLVIMLNTVATQVSCYTVLPMLFEQEHRYTGVATGFNLGVILAGGTAPFVAVWMVEKTGNVLSPAYFVIAAAAIGLLAMATVSRQLKSSYRLAV